MAGRFGTLTLACIGGLVMVVSCAREPWIPRKGSASDETQSSADERAVTASRGALSANTLGMRLFGQMSREASGGNRLLAPFGMSRLLGMLALGAGGPTQRALLDALATTSEASLRSDQGALNASLAETAGGESELVTAARVWTQDAAPAAYLSALTQVYGADQTTIDFAADPVKARTAVNEWAAAASRGQVPELLSSDALSQRTRVVLTDVTAFKAAWEFPFDHEATKPGRFVADAGARTVEMMVQTRDFAYAESDRYQLVQLPYAGDRFAMMVVLPRTAGDRPWDEPSFMDDLLQLMAGARTERVTVTMPAFEAHASVHPAAALAELGYGAAFDTTADYSPMGAGGDAIVTELVQEVVLEVTEAGTEAAAGSAAVVGMRGGRGVELKADHPFFYAAVDRLTGALLFVGALSDPGAA